MALYLRSSVHLSELIAFRVSIEKKKSFSLDFDNGFIFLLRENNRGYRKMIMSLHNSVTSIQIETLSKQEICKTFFNFSV